MDSELLFDSNCFFCLRMNDRLAVLSKAPRSVSWSVLSVIRSNCWCRCKKLNYENFNLIQRYDRAGGRHVAFNQQLYMRLGCNLTTYRDSTPLSVSRIVCGIKEISFIS